eukprot:TRINITY_DN27180_c0_g1_i1.p2 TRINITY_DN27180_c0_g1~~TRINITY_DN27180_c0_g1_i1.p2  ORF type:complete len:207 (+),score=44.08 TRINITY_DN27180_c0_g1_i1:93-623(+)
MTTKNIHEAAFQGKRISVIRHIQNGADVDATDAEGQTVVNLAAKHARPSTVHAVLDAGASIHAKGFMGRTPLHEAAAKGMDDVVQRLLAGGADVNASDDCGDTPLHLAVGACGMSHETTAQLLIDAGADLGATNQSNYTPFGLAEDMGTVQVAQVVFKNGGRRDSISSVSTAMSAC